MNYQQLVDEQANAMGVSSLPVETESTGNAATDLKRIFINPDFASQIHTTAGINGIRFVLAHELGHARAPGGAAATHDGELAADRWAAQSIARIGIGLSPAEAVMRSLHPHATETHPGSDTRMGAVQVAWEGESRVEAPKLPRSRPRHRIDKPRARDGEGRRRVSPRERDPQPRRR